MIAYQGGRPEARRLEQEVPTRRPGEQDLVRAARCSPVDQQPPRERELSVAKRALQEAELRGAPQAVRAVKPGQGLQPPEGVADRSAKQRQRQQEPVTMSPAGNAKRLRARV